MEDEIRRVEPLDDPEADIEEWTRVTEDPDVRGVDVSLLRHGGDWPWQIFVSAAEFVRDEPLESEFRRRINDAIRGTAGVSETIEEDREIWLAAGSPDGADLTRSVAEAIDSMAQQIQAATEGDG